MGIELDMFNLTDDQWHVVTTCVVDNPPTGERADALDNLLTLFGLVRKANALGQGVVIYHPDQPSKTRWVSLKDSEESWLEDVKLLAR